MSESYIPNRQPLGIPVGGQFAANVHAEPQVEGFGSSNAEWVLVPVPSADGPTPGQAPIDWALERAKHLCDRGVSDSVARDVPPKVQKELRKGQRLLDDHYLNLKELHSVPVGTTSNGGLAHLRDTYEKKATDLALQDPVMPWSVRNRDRKVKHYTLMAAELGKVTEPRW